MKYIFLLLISASSWAIAQKPCGYKDGLQEGSCKDFYENGQVKQVVEWKKGKIDGEAVYYHENGKVKAKGENKKGYKYKNWEYYDKNGVLTSKEYYRNGEKNIYDDNSTATFYSPNGKINEVSNYKFGKLDGESTLYHEDGKTVKQVGRHVNGLAEGKWKTYYPSGKLERETELVNDKRHGTRTYYREDGSVLKTEVYKNGQLISTK